MRDSARSGYGSGLSVVAQTDRNNTPLQIGQCCCLSHPWKCWKSFQMNLFWEGAENGGLRHQCVNYWDSPGTTLGSPRVTRSLPLDDAPLNRCTDGATLGSAPR